MVELICIIGVTFSCFLILIMGARLAEIRRWNGGVCAKSGERWDLYTANYGGSRGYKDMSGNTVWISFKIDKRDETCQ